MKSSTEPAAWLMRSISFLMSSNFEPEGMRGLKHSYLGARSNWRIDNTS
jgi:hypothetical protein